MKNLQKTCDIMADEKTKEEAREKLKKMGEPIEAQKREIKRREWMQNLRKRIKGLWRLKKK